MIAGTDLLAVLPVAVYTTDAEGVLTFYNDAAAKLWGYRPELGSSRWCGSWRLFWPDGQPMAHNECPMAVALREGRILRGVEAVLERPDGSRVPFTPYPTVFRDASGAIIGAINLLVDVTQRQHAEIESARLAAIVSSSDDAIISKTLDGTITSWNAGAARIFGYEPEEMIGQSILRIIPPDLRHEEAGIIAKIQRGERVDHFDTVRIGKDGRRINISVTISPLRDRSGTIVGASKVARDITERKQNEELRQLLFAELNHRVKNMLATIQAIATQSLRRGTTPADFVPSFTGRVRALGKAHDLIVQGKLQGADIMEILREQVLLGAPEGSRISSHGPSVMLGPRAAVQLALVVHELATNARKYGALASPAGQLSISWRMLTGNAGRGLVLEWRERGVANIRAPEAQGFGTTLIQRSLEGYGGEATIDYGPDGISCDLRLPLTEDDREGFATTDIMIARAAAKAAPPLPTAWPKLDGGTVLLVEDEPLVSMEIETQLTDAGCEVVGIAGNLRDAARLIETVAADVALVDANLSGRPVDGLAAALVRKGIPFAFATGYGSDALPGGFGEVPILTKPFTDDQLRITIGGLVERRDRGGPIRLVPKSA
jgi:PAS domain S-box-containing protein